ncbi:MAG TPA: hypothetical protein VFR86_11515 [Burkholderiaceae bacterium]|nr:hypothetical protein [Burkholderiaceae bacterium]
METIMSLRPLRFVTLFLTALAMTLYVVHLLELEPRVQYDPQLYAVITHPYYGWLEIAGLLVQLWAVAAAVLLAYVAWPRPSFGFVVCALLSMVAAIFFWVVLVMPITEEWLHAILDIERGSDIVARLGARWLFGHALAFIAWLSAAVILLLSRGFDGESAPEPIPHPA